ncbi:terminal uridylyltransferase 4-like isoform X2 [Acanthaster planci]|uniref:Terminal uridylyltransferase 4-like isoform X2 n=1 Tax=Acanthaster planci TaxID=133434 RepID=A0A8B7ZPH3_ACAPL|nr:terminal uridylyltransferase 4-like isoform X2 [Acanthaster planci]
MLRRTIPDVEVNLYGSSLSGFGFQDSDVNLGMEVPEQNFPPEILVRAFEALIPEDAYVEDVHSDFEGHFPCIRFSDKESGLRCELSTCSLSAMKTSKLLSQYRQLDTRVHSLAMSLRYWARLCRLDSQSDGSIPAYAFVLMTIYFLQHCNPPVVPVLQENETLECQNVDSLGELWIKMLRFYAVEVAVEKMVISVRNREPITREELKIPNRRLAIEDPIALNKKNIAKSLTSNTVFQYLMDRLQGALLYFGKPQKTTCTCKSQAVNSNKTFSAPNATQPHCDNDTSEEDDNCTKSETSDDNATKILDLGNAGLQPKHCVELDTESQQTRFRKMCVSEENVGSSIPKDLKKNATGNSQLTQSSKGRESFSTTYKQKTKTEDDSGMEYVSDKSSVGRNSDTCNCVYSLTVDSSGRNDLVSGVDANDQHISTTCEQDCDVPDKQICSDDWFEADVEQEKESTAITDSQPGDNKSEISFCEHSLNFTFCEKILTGGKKVITVCNGCGKEGHKVAECPDDAVPNLAPLPPMDEAFLKKIDELCRSIEDRYCLRDWVMMERDQAVASYEKFIRCNGYPDAVLRLFGSSRNGFGFWNSDMDICLKFRDSQNPEHIDIPTIIEDLAQKLKRHSSLQHIIPISTAKVPIVKFFDQRLQLDVDVSLYNCLAQANTQMLYVYSKIDPRVRQLVYTAKVFVKKCDIGDASKGSLSSYAYTLMMIFFLQQRDPPVLPVLQELYSGEEKPQNIVEGRNAWFFSNLKKLKHFWRCGNKESVGELWLGFLRFFTEEFNIKKHVVCIRQHKPLTRFEKMWTSSARGYAIEDPFDLDHNLGSGVSRKMTTFISQVFINARERFGIPNRTVSSRNDFIHEYFFDTFVLTGGEAPPNDRCCRVCGKVGHFLKDCPHRKGHKEIQRSRERNQDSKKTRNREINRNKPQREQAKNDVNPSPNIQAAVPKQSATVMTAGDRKNTAAASCMVSENADDRKRSQNVTTVMKPEVTEEFAKVTAVQTTVDYSQGHGLRKENSIGDNWELHLKEKKRQKTPHVDQSRMSKPHSGNSKGLVHNEHVKVEQPLAQTTTSLLHKALLEPKILDRQSFQDIQRQQQQYLQNARQQLVHQSQSFPSCQSALSIVSTSSKNAHLVQGSPLSYEQPDCHQEHSHQRQQLPQHKVQQVLPQEEQHQRIHSGQEGEITPKQFQQQQERYQQQQYYQQKGRMQYHTRQQEKQEHLQLQGYQPQWERQLYHHQQQQQYHQQQQRQQYQQQQRRQQHQQQQYPNQQWQYQYQERQQFSSQPKIPVQSKQNQPCLVQEQQSTGGRFNLECFNQLAHSLCFQQSLHPSEKPRTLQEIEEAQLRKHQPEHKEQIKPNFTVSEHHNGTTEDQIFLLSHVANSPAVSARIEESPCLNSQASVHGINPDSAQFGVLQGKVWDQNSQPILTPPTGQRSLGGSGLPVNTSQLCQMACEVSPITYQYRTNFEESNIGSALLQGVGMLQNRDDGNQQDDIRG